MNTKETFEQGQRREAVAMIELQNIAIKRNAWQCCLNCEFWNRPPVSNAPGSLPEGCRKFKAMPPPHIIVTGCPEYLIDIPF